MPRNTKYSSYWILSIWQCSVICLFHIYLCTKHDLQGKDIYFNFFCIHLYSYSHKLILQNFNANQCRGASVHPGRTTWSGCPSEKRGRQGGREERTEGPPTPLGMTAAQGHKPSLRLTAGRRASSYTAAMVSPDSGEPQHHHHHQLPVSCLVLCFSFASWGEHI